MTADIYIYFPTGKEGAGRTELEEELEGFFGGDARFSGAGSGVQGANLDFELEDGEDVGRWVTHRREFLRSHGAKPGTVFEVFPEDWEPGKPWRRVEVFGRDGWITERDR
ncbi:MAG: hypothetical protein K2W96_02615 [Gemmataceae bacterium]|nr:hypothetical protein [Gemmataceae bacterium]